MTKVHWEKLKYMKIYGGIFHLLGTNFLLNSAQQLSLLWKMQSEHDEEELINFDLIWDLK